MLETLRSMPKRKTCADGQLVAEMLQTDHAGLLDTMAQIFTDLLNGKAEVPASWRKTKLVILNKKGDTKLPKTFSPIAIFPF